MHLFRQNSKNPLSNIVRIGNREIITRGLNSGFWTDLYHRSMTVSWPVFFASAALAFIALNGTFALVYGAAGGSSGGASKRRSSSRADRFSG